MCEVQTIWIEDLKNIKDDIHTVQKESESESYLDFLNVKMKLKQENWKKE